MSESMREAVEGFERERAAGRCEVSENAVPLPDEPSGQAPRWYVVACLGESSLGRITFGKTDLPSIAAGDRVPATFLSRQDVLDLATAANDARATAIAAPKLAESCNALADRLENLAVRLGALVPKEGA